MAIINNIMTDKIKRVMIHGYWFDVLNHSFQVHSYELAITEGTVFSGGNAYSFLEGASKLRMSGPLESIQAYLCDEDTVIGEHKGPNVTMSEK